MQSTLITWNLVLCQYRGYDLSSRPIRSSVLRGPLRRTFVRRRLSFLCYNLSMKSIFVTRRIPDRGLKLLESKGYSVDVSAKEGVLTKAELINALQSKPRSEEHTSELQSPDHLVCRLLLEKKKN